MVACGLVLLAQATAFAYRSGPPAAVDGSTAAGGASCRACHGSTLGGGSVQILGFPPQYVADAVYNISVRITDPTKLGAGFQASVQTSGGQPAGTIIRTDTLNTQLNQSASPFWRGINHSSSGVGNAVTNWSLMGNSAEYSFQWRAPATDVGPVTAFAAGNAINNNFSSSGDLIYLRNVSSSFGGFPTGACCDESTGICSEDVSQGQCEGPGVRFGGVESSCADFDPPCEEAAGACCDDSTGDCTEGVPRTDCESGGNRFGGGLTTCSTIDPPCVEPTGACCDGNTGLCTDGLTVDACTGDQRTWTVDAVCADLDPPCTEHTGACCDELSGSCEDGVPGSQCGGADQSWAKGASCASVTCVAAVGACCDSDTFGACTDGSTLAECSCPTCTWAEGESCNNLDCAHTTIPTVGEWGMAVLTLLLLIAAKIAFPQGDRRPRAVA